MQPQQTKPIDTPKKPNALPLFNEVLLSAINKTLTHVFGEINTRVVYNYLEKRGCKQNDIPSKLDEFSAELRKLIGPGRGQILGAAPLLEETIVETITAELRIELTNRKSTNFADTIKRLRETYNKRRQASFTQTF